MTKANTKTHTDIKTGGPVIRYIPERARPYVYLARLDRPIGIWLLLLPGWWAIVMASGGVQLMNAHDWKIFALFGAGAVVMRAAGCVINDLWDREIDQKVERTRIRPLASSAISVKAAGIFLFALLISGLAILLQMNLVTILLGILSLPLIIVYPLMKRFTWWPQAFLGLTFNFGALMGWAAISVVPEGPALLLYVSGILWTLGYDTVYAHQDKEDDMLAGIKSTALKFGENSLLWVRGFYGASWVFLALAAALAFGKWYAPLFLLPAAGHLFWQLKRWDAGDADSSLNTFKSNRDYGFLVLAGLALAGLVA